MYEEQVEKKETNFIIFNIVAIDTEVYNKGDYDDYYPFD